MNKDSYQFTLEVREREREGGREGEREREREGNRPVERLVLQVSHYLGYTAPSSWLTVVIGLLSLLILLLPLDGESSSWPPWLHVTVNMKLIASFVLGKDTHTHTLIKIFITHNSVSFWLVVTLHSQHCIVN